MLLMACIICAQAQGQAWQSLSPVNCVCLEPRLWSWSHLPAPTVSLPSPVLSPALCLHVHVMTGARAAKNGLWSGGRGASEEYHSRKSAGSVQFASSPMHVAGCRGRNHGLEAITKRRSGLVLVARYRAVPAGPWHALPFPPVLRLGWDGAGRSTQTRATYQSPNLSGRPLKLGCWRTDRLFALQPPTKGT